MITETFQEQIKAKLKEWKVEIDGLEAKVNQVNVTARNEYERQLDALSAKWQSIEEKFQQLQHASGEQWEELRLEFDTALVAFERSFKQASARLQEALEGLGWTEGMAKTRPHDSEGWVEGLGHQEPDSEGWVEGVGHREDDSIGWPEGQARRKS